MITANYEIIKYRPEFKEQVLALQRHLWGGDRELNLAYMQWKFEENPYAQDSTLVLALHEGRVVGMGTAYGALWAAGKPEQEFRGPVLADIVIDPVHRAKASLFREMVDFMVQDLRERGFEAVFALSAALGVRLSLLRWKWPHPGFFQLATHYQKNFLQSRPVWKRRAAKIYAQILFNPHRPFELLQRHARIRGKVAVERGPRSAAMADLVRQLGSPSGRIRQVRNEEFFKWRFNNPLSEFCFVYSGGKQLNGYLVLARSRMHNPHEIHIVDWEATDGPAAEVLLQEVIRFGFFEEVQVRNMSLDEGRQNMLNARGFTFFKSGGSLLKDVRRNSVIFGKTLQAGKKLPSGMDLTKTADWDLRPVYADRF